MAEEKKSATVVVKKADGTYVRMSMADFKHMKDVPQKESSHELKLKNIPKAAVDAKVNIKVAASSKDNPNKKEGEKKVFVSPASPSVKSISKHDFILPLEEDSLTGIKGSTSLVSDSRLSEVEEIIKKLSFSVDAQIMNRLRSAIQLCLKDIRTEDQTRELLMRTTKEGGVGLDKKQAEEIINHCLEKNVPQVYKEPPVPAMVASMKNSKNSLSTSSIMGKVDPLKSTEPVIVKQENKSSETSKLTINPAEQVSLKDISSEETFRLSKPRIKPLVRDIVSKSVEVGPVEELGGVTLTDFRYLAPAPQEAAARLGQKFLNLKAESILLYLDGIDAWRKSPLYTEYTTALSEALVKRKPLATVLTDKQKIQLGEITALVNMEKEFVH